MKLIQIKIMIVDTLAGSSGLPRESVMDCNLGSGFVKDRLRSHKVIGWQIVRQKEIIIDGRLRQS